MDTSHTDLSRRHFISTPAKVLPIIALGATGLAGIDSAQAQDTMIQTKSGDRKKVVILATGGTIAGTADSEVEMVAYTAAQRTVDELLAGVPVPDFIDFEAYQIAQVDSKDISFQIWRDLALKVEEIIARPDVSGVVITHGTDTLEETAYFLDLTVNATKPVVLTAAMRPATALGADGPLNLLNSITLAVSGGKGVMAVLNGLVYSGAEVRKEHTSRVEAFSAGQAGPIGMIEGDIIYQWRPWPTSQQILKPSKIPADTNKWPWVEIVMSCAGCTGEAVPALVNAGVNGIVVAATGNGTIHERMLEKLLLAQDGGLPIVRAARVGDGLISSADTDGIIKSPCTLPAKARVRMIVELLKR